MHFTFLKLNISKRNFRFGFVQKYFQKIKLASNIKFKKFYFSRSNAYKKYFNYKKMFQIIISTIIVKYLKQGSSTKV